MGESRHPSVAEKMSFFEHNHLPDPLKIIAHNCGILAELMLNEVDDHPQLALGLQKLIEAKDCFVRARVVQHNKEMGNPNQGSPLPRPDKVV